MPDIGAMKMNENRVDASLLTENERALLGGLFKKVKDAGLYNADYTGENAG